MDQAQRQSLERAATALPLPIAQNVRAFLDDPTRLPPIFFAAESALRFVCAALKSAYLADASAPSPAMNELLRKWTLHPAMGSWRHLLEGAVKLVDAGAVPVPFDGFSAVAAALRSPDVEVLIQRRNDLYGHVGTVLPHETELAAIEELAPRLCRVLAGLEALAGCPLVVFDARAQAWLWCMGVEPRRADGPVDLAGPCPAVLNRPSGPLPLFPLIVGSFEGFESTSPLSQPESVLVFDGADLGRERVVYVGRFGRGHGKRWFDEYRRLLHQKRVPLVDAGDVDVTCEWLQRRFRDAFDGMYAFALDGELIHKGDRLDESVCGGILDAVSSSASLAWVVGDAGIGKTAHLIEAGRRLAENGTLVLLIQAGEAFADPQRSFQQQLRRNLEHQLALHAQLAPLLELIGGCESSAKLVLLVDGVDECGSPARVKMLVAEIADWIAKSTRSRVVRVVISIRTMHYERLAAMGNPTDRLQAQVYRPTRKAPSGTDAIDTAIWVLPTTRLTSPSNASRDRLPRHRVKPPPSPRATAAGQLVPECFATPSRRCG